jgi:hypothetical protein
MRAILVLGVIVCSGYLVFVIGPIRAQYRRMQLLCRTDHQALLNAGRDILSHVHIEPDPNGLRRLGSFSVPRDISIPKVIRNLRCGVGITYDGYMIIEMGGGMDHFGVRIYPENFKAPEPRFFRYGDRKLIEGLWYYDDEYVYDPQGYDKTIEWWLSKCGKLGK